jgi:transglutaminase-like putative cysteine protease
MKKILKLLFAISFFLTLTGAAYAEADFNYSDISEITYKILYPGIPSNIFPDNGKQTMTPSKNDICYVKVFSEGIRNRNFAYPIKKNNKNKKLLKANPYIDSSDERIKEIAAIFTKDEKNVLNIIMKSQNWVEQNIKNDPTEHLPRTTKEVLDNFEGNQSEKILIISAILKAAGIPNKVVIGLHYNVNKAMPKLWLSVYTDQWNDVDPTSDRLDIFTPDNIVFIKLFWITKMNWRFLAERKISRQTLIFQF